MKMLTLVAAFLPSVVLCSVLTLPDQTFDQPVGTGVETTLLFSQFDDVGGTRVLTGVRLTFDAGMQTDAFAENMADTENIITLKLTDGQVLADGPGALDVVADLSAFAPISVTVAASDGTNGSGPDYHDFGTVTASQNGLVTDLSSDLGAFIGTETVSITVDASGEFGIGSVGGHAGSIQSFRTTGVAGLSYTYTTTPEPCSAMLLLAALSTFAARRRGRIQGARGTVS